MMVNHALIAFIRLVANTFFRRIDVAGEENIPPEGPVIFAGNHPNALMDGCLLISKCGRWPLHFMANAKLWEYRMLAPVLNSLGAVPVYRKEEHDDKVDNQTAFDRLYEVIESGNCMGIFPEGISHMESRLAKLKTGAARIALAVSARGNTRVKIVPCGLTYIHRHRFRSQALLEFGEPIVIDDEWIRDYRLDELSAVRRLTDLLADALSNVTLNAPDWRTLRFIQTARRLYKPASAELPPRTYVDLSRRFVDGYVLAIDDPEIQRIRAEVEDYQSQLDLLGLKDYQLRQTVNIGVAFRKLISRGFMLLLLLPVAIPGAVLHLPIGWLAAFVGERFSYERDDVATLKVFATILLLPILYVLVAIVVGAYFGFWWGVLVVLLLPLSSFASVRLLEAEVGLMLSMLSILRLVRLSSDVEELQRTRSRLVAEVRALVDRLADPNVARIFGPEDFGQPGQPSRS